MKTYYSLFYIIPGDAGESHLKKRLETCRYFKRDLTIRKDSPAHITLKYDMELDDKQVGELETFLEKFCAKEKPSPFVLSGLGHFDNSAVYVDVQPSDAMLDTQKRLLKYISQFPWAQMREYEREGGHLHATLMRRIPKKIFADVWAYVQDHQVHEELVFDHIALCPIVKGKRIVQRIFSLVADNYSSIR